MKCHYDARTDTVKYLLDGGKIIGFYRYTLWPREDPRPRAAHVLDIAILPACRKRGLGTLLMNDLIQDSRKRGLDRILSRSFKSNDGSMRLHRSLGFTQIESTEDSIVWELKSYAR